MQIGERLEGSVVILVPQGDMDVTTLPAFEGRLEALLDGGVRAVLWDLEAVGMLPSTALGFLLQARRRLGRVGGAMGLARANRIVRRALSTMGVLDVFPMYETPEEGVADLAARLETSGD